MARRAGSKALPYGQERVGGVIEYLGGFVKAVNAGSG